MSGGVPGATRGLQAFGVSRSPAAFSVGRLSVGEAAELVRNAIYGKECIGELTPRELWLISTYVEGTEESPADSTLSGTIRYSVIGCSWKKYPWSQKLRDEVEEALDRRLWRHKQWERAYGWLEEHGFASPAMDGSALERVLLEWKRAYDKKVVPPHLQEEQAATDRLVNSASQERSENASETEITLVLKEMFPHGIPHGSAWDNQCAVEQKLGKKIDRDLFRRLFRGWTGRSGPGRPRKARQDYPQR